MPLAHTLPVGKQRRVVFLAILALFATLITVPQLRDGARGESLAQAKPYLPYPCRTAGGAVDNRRATFPLYNTDRQRGTTDTHVAGRMFPCISGTRWRMRFGVMDDSVQRGFVQAVNIADTSGSSWPFAGANSASGLYHLSFNNFIINPTTNNVSLETIRDTPVAGQSPYVLRFTPAGGITIGGNGVMTDMLVTGNSEIRARGTGPFGIQVWLRLAIEDYGGVEWLLTSNDFPVAGVDLQFYYLTTHVSNPGGTNPYLPSSAPAGAAVQMPDTTIQVLP